MKNVINYPNIEGDKEIHDFFIISEILNQLLNAFHETVNILMILPISTTFN